MSKSVASKGQSEDGSFAAGPEESATDDPPSNTFKTSTSSFLTPKTIHPSRTIPSSTAGSSRRKNKITDRAQEDNENDYEEDQQGESVQDGIMISYALGTDIFMK